MIRTGGPQDVPFLRDMLQHAYYWRVDRVSESGEPPVRRYVERWGRPGDTALIAIQDFQPVGAAWYRMFTSDNPGYGFVDEATPELGDPSWILVTLYGGGQAGVHAARSPEQKAQMDPELVKYAEAAASMTVIEYVRAIAARQALVDTLRRFFERYDLLITPTVCLPAFSLGIVGPREVAGREVTHLGWTLCYPFNYSGQPAVSVPAGFTASGLPVGLQIIGRRGEDALVLRAAATFEALRPWASRRPSES